MLLRTTMLAVAIVALSCSFAVGQRQQAQALKIGDKAPDFSLETFDNEKITLSERFGSEGKHTILLFSRANW